MTELRDGTRVLLRPIRPDDAPRLQALHARLSPQSVYLRWLSAHPVLTDEEAANLSQLDYRDRMAYVAILPEASPDEIMGVARYAAIPSEGPGVAEAAVAVADAYQQRGLGTLLSPAEIEYSPNLIRFDADNPRQPR